MTITLPNAIKYHYKCLRILLAEIKIIRRIKMLTYTKATALTVCRVVIWGSLLALAGCSAVPTVQYVRVDRADQLNGKEIDTYYLQGSVITIAPKQVQVDGKLTDEIIIQSTPAEFLKFKLALRKADSLGVKTTVNIAKVENTDLVSEIGTEVTDNRLDYIAKIGGAVVSIASKAFSNSLGDYQEIRLTENSDMTGEGGKDAIEIKTGETKIYIQPIPVDAISIKEIEFPFESNSFLYSACRDATITHNKKGKISKQTLKVADPRFVQRVSFPLKGKIKMHSQCGVSIQTEKDTGITSGPALIQAVVAQAIAVKEALDKKGSGTNK